MKKLQQRILKQILEGEQLSISALSEKTEINRSLLSQLLNHNKQLSENNFDALKECYPEYAAEEVSKEAPKPAAPKKVEKPAEIKKPEKPVEQPKSKVQDKIVEPKEKKEIKTKEEKRHRNLNCPESGYHMKVQYKDLLRGRPLCPLTQLPMMLKEELRRYKQIVDEEERKKFTASLASNINLLTK